MDAADAGMGVAGDPADESLWPPLAYGANGHAHGRDGGDDPPLSRPIHGDGDGGGMGDRRIPLTYRELTAIVGACCGAVVVVLLQWFALSSSIHDLGARMDGRFDLLGARVERIETSVTTATSEIRSHALLDGHPVEMAGQRALEHRMDAMEARDRPAGRP